MNWWPHYAVTIQVVRRGRPVRKTIRLSAPNRQKAESLAIATEKDAKLLSSILAKA